MLSFTGSFAQSELSSSETQTFKKAVAEKVKDNATLSGNFTQTQQMEYMQSDVESSGVFFYKKPDKLKWSYKKPYLFSLLFKNGHVIINNDGNRKNMSVSSNPLFEKLSGLIAHSINGKLLDDKDFTSSYFYEKNFVLVKLIPQEEDLKEIFSKVELYFDPETRLVKKAKLTQPEGDSTLIHFEDVKLNAKIPESVFDEKE